ncbi:M4 family metallopeptidase [Vicingaceae bacterium]|nr:M4 family metallopeptidase [Vicingaceae bacterium]
MKKILLSLIYACSLGAQAQIATLNGSKAAAAFPNAIEVRIEEGNVFPSYIELDATANISEESFFSILGNQILPSTKFSFRILNTNTDQLGFEHKRYRMYYDGVEVAYSNLSVHVRNSKVVSASGNITAVVPSIETPSLTEEAAKTYALNSAGANEYMWEIDKPSNYLESEFYPKAKQMYLPNYFEGNNTLTLTYAFNIYATQPLNRELIFVNAQSGVVQFRESLLHTGGDSKATAITAYSDTQEIVTDSLNGFFRLRDSTRGTAIVTLNSLTQRNYTGAVDFIDSNNFWNNFNASRDEYATDAHWGTEATYDYMLNVHNRNSIDNNGFPLVSFVHYDQNYANAFWNGTVMTYGDGNSTSSLSNPLVSLDIVAHEITHGLTDFTADLIYANESGALNESFSDIFGTALEFYARPTRANWLIGEDVGGAIRSMINPNAFRHPDTYEGQSWRQTKGCIPTNNNDKCGVHSNSGVQNHWFYLLSNGGTGVNDATDSFTVVGLGISKAEKIAFRNLTVYLNPSSNHDEARFYAIKSAIDLYGACSPEVEATTNAWYAVGVGAEYVNVVSASFSALQDTAFCYSPVTLDFISEGSNIANFIWDFGNGDTSSLRNPTTDYFTQGTFNVQLIGDGGTCGSDTVLKTSYIIIDTSTVSCSFTLDNLVNTTLTDCRGRLFDSGGFGGSYGNNESGSVTIAVASADYIELDFILLDIEAGVGFNCNRDFIEVYDGPSISAPLIGRYCKNFPPLNNMVITSSNTVTIRMISDNVATVAGFIINWDCKTAVAAPIADFSINSDTTCTGMSEFRNRSTEGYSSALWNFGDGTTSADYHPSHNYYADGTYTVSLTVGNSQGSNTTTKTNVVAVTKLSSPSVLGDTVCIGAQAGIKVNVASTGVWYRDTTASSIYLGDSLTILGLQRDTVLYVKEVSNNPIFSGGPLNNIGSGSYSSSNDYMTFDVHKPILLRTMILFSNKAATRRMDVWNNQGELVVSKDIYVPGSPLRVNINIELQPDSNYRVSFSDRDISLFRNSSGATYPYAISNLVTIKGSNNGNSYPYFYRWGVSELPCESNFVTAGAVIDTTCNIVGIQDNQMIEDQVLIRPNPFTNNLSVDYKFNNDTSVDFVIRATNGQDVYRKNGIQSSGVEVIDLSFLTKGVYIFTVITEDKVQTYKIIKSN